MTDCWRRYLAKAAARGGGDPDLNSTNITILDTSSGYNHVSPGSSVIYNHVVYEAGVPVTVNVGVNTGDTVTSMRMVLVEPGNNPQPSLCVGGGNNGNACGFDYVGCPSGACGFNGICEGGDSHGMPCGVDQCPGGTCTGIRRTCVGGNNAGAACTVDANCTGGGRCERAIGVEVDQCSNNGNGTWTCQYTPTVDHAGSLVVEAEIAGHDLDVDADTATVIAGTRRWGIPTMSEWGFVVLTLLVLSSATIVMLRARQGVPGLA
jgi:hypothetical protein